MTIEGVYGELVVLEPKREQFVDLHFLTPAQWSRENKVKGHLARRASERCQPRNSRTLFSIRFYKLPDWRFFVFGSLF